MASASGQRPTRRSTSGLANGAAPHTRTLPRLGRSWPAAKRRKVVLPEPLGPSRPQMPGPRCRDTSCSAVTCPYHLVSCTARMLGASLGTLASAVRVALVFWAVTR